ncbi:MAG: protein kinase domain-containing protein [Gemmatimonadaceae bacterium]
MRADQSDPLREQLQASLGRAYTLERELSGGGMARLFVAREEALERNVVVKVLPPELAEGLSAERFAREIRLAAQLQEPHIVPVLASGTTQSGLPYYTMPFVRGESLRERLRGGPLLLDDATGILRDVAQALAYAHQRGVVHRDIKPENVLLSGGTAMVTDFGIAKAVGVARTHDSERSASATLTLLGTTLGTPAYMAPEQCAGDVVDARSDLYSWGVVAYELLAGKHPFAGELTAQELIVAHLSERPAPLSASRADLPPALAALVMSCLAKDPNRRPQIAEELVASLRAVGRSARAPRRRVLAAWAVAAVVVAVGGAFLVRAGRSESPSALGSAAADAPGNADASRYSSSLAVLPLVNYSRDPAQDYFADGMTDELTTTLSKLQALRVIAHRSMLQFKRSEHSVPEIARQLGVKYLMDGSVQQDGDRVRIRATLIDAATNATVWTESFDRERRDVLVLQHEVALAIARAIELTLTPQDRSRLADTLPVDPVAFDLYIKGTQARYRAFGAAENLEAKRYYERAVERDPNYAPAHAGLALMQINAGDTAAARRSAERARALDPTLADASMALGMLRQSSDAAGAEDAIRRAIRLNPGHAEAHHELSMLLLRRNRLAEALRESQLTLYLSPLTARFEQGLGEVHLFSGRYDDALIAADKALSHDSTYTPPYFLQAYAYSQQRKFDKAEEALTKCNARACGEAGRPLLGYVYALSGRRTDALRILDTLTAQWRRNQGAPGHAYGIAQVHVALGERERAIDWLEREEKVGGEILYAGIDPIFRSLHSEPRFRALLRKRGLTESP